MSTRPARSTRKRNPPLLLLSAFLAAAALALPAEASLPRADANTANTAALAGAEAVDSSPLIAAGLEKPFSLPVGDELEKAQTCHPAPSLESLSSAEGAPLEPPQLASRACATSFSLHLEPVDFGLNPQRGPPLEIPDLHQGWFVADSKTRIGGFRLELEDLIGGERSLTLELHWGYEVGRVGLTEDEPPDPWGLYEGAPALSPDWLSVLQVSLYGIWAAANSPAKFSHPAVGAALGGGVVAGRLIGESVPAPTGEGSLDDWVTRKFTNLLSSPVSMAPVDRSQQPQTVTLPTELPPPVLVFPGPPKVRSGPPVFPIETKRLPTATSYPITVVPNPQTVLPITDPVDSQTLESTPLDAPGYWNYYLVDPSGKRYYHGMAGPEQNAADVEYRHSNTPGRFDKPAGDQLVQHPGTRTYEESRRMEDALIRKDETLLPNPRTENKDNYRGNRQQGISPKNKRFHPKQ